jgi:hypothetical protein
MSRGNITVPYEPPQWNSAPAWKLPGWGEPVVSVAPSSPQIKLKCFEDGCEYFSYFDDIQ